MHSSHRSFVLLLRATSKLMHYAVGHLVFPPGSLSLAPESRSK
jgi:hypothetical protein